MYTFFKELKILLDLFGWMIQNVLSGQAVYNATRLASMVYTSMEPQDLLGLSHDQDSHIIFILNGPGVVEQKALYCIVMAFNK